MAFRIKLNTGNAAFGETVDERAAEVARLLREVAGKLEAASGPAHTVARGGELRDVNGNVCGDWALTRRD